MKVDNRRRDQRQYCYLRRLAAIFVTIALLAVGSGVAGFIHNLHHAHDDHASVPASGKHDESTCAIHAQLRAPMLAGGYVPVLVSLGLFIAFLTLLAESPAAQVVHIRLDCRGPPAACSISA